MAAAANPLAAALQAKMAALSGGGSGAPGGGGGMPPNSMGDDSMGDQLSQMSSELHGADPGLVLQQLQKIRSLLVATFVKTAMSLPNVSNQIAQVLKANDRAIKEAQQAATTASAVRPPVGLSVANQPGAPAGGGEPGAPS